MSEIRPGTLPLSLLTQPPFGDRLSKATEADMRHRSVRLSMSSLFSQIHVEGVSVADDEVSSINRSASCVDRC